MKSRFIWVGAGLCAAIVAACAVTDPAADTSAPPSGPPRLAGPAAQAILAQAQSDARVLDSVLSLKQHGWSDPDWSNGVVEIRTAPSSGDNPAASFNVAMVPMQRANHGSISRAHINFVDGDASSEGVAITGDDADSFAAVRADLESDAPPAPSPSLTLDTPESPDAAGDVEPDVHVNWCSWSCQAVGNAACWPFKILGSIVCGTLSNVACGIVCGGKKHHICTWSRKMLGHPCILFGKWVLIPTQGEVHTCNGYEC